MARSIWSGSLSFGLVSIPVGLYPVSQDHTVHFHMVTPDGSCRLRRKLYCPETGKEYDFSETARGFEIAPDEYVVVDPEELEALQPEKGEELELQNFIALKDIDPILYRTSYYLLPGKKAEKPYQLLVRALEEADRVGIGEFVMREKEYLAAVRPYEHILVLETLFFADELRNPKDLIDFTEQARIDSEELELAKQLVRALTKPFKHREFKDEYQVELLKYLRKRSKTKKPRKIKGLAAHREPKATVINLTARLKESLKVRGDKTGGRSRTKRRAAS